jgi:hypothetical protein
MNSWIMVPQQDFIRASGPASQPAAGVKFYRSPFDVPCRIRADVDEERHLFSISFEYLGTEQQVSVSLDEHVSVSVGKNSGRIYSVTINMTGISTPVELESALFAALNSPLRNAIRPENLENYGAARSVIERTKEKLFATIPAFA